MSDGLVFFGIRKTPSTHWRNFSIKMSTGLGFIKHIILTF